MPTPETGLARWLVGLDRPARAIRLHDDRVLSKVAGGGAPLKCGIDRARFEAAYGLRPLERHTVSLDRLGRRLAVDEGMWVRLAEGVDSRYGSLVEGWVDTLLPRVGGALSDEAPERRVVVYVLSRIVTGDIPAGTKWLARPVGIGPLAHALFHIHNVAQLTGSGTAWTRPLMTGTAVREQRAVWPGLTLHGDGARASNWGQLIANLRARLHSLLFRPLEALCVSHSVGGSTRRMTWRSIQEVVGCEAALARRLRTVVPLLMTERHVPVLHSLGLRLRYVLTEKSRPVLVSPGLVERYTAKVVRATRRERVPGLTVHLEPLDSSGPTDWPTDEVLMELTAERVVVSVRMDMFDREQEVPFAGVRGVWHTGEPVWPVDRDRAVVLDTGTVGRGGGAGRGRVTRYAVALLGILWAHRGPGDHTARLMRASGLTPKTVSANMEVLRQAHAVLSAYHPNVEYMGLPEGVVVLLHGASAREVRDMVKETLARSPYAEVMTDERAGDMVALIRLPSLVSPLGELLETVSGEHYEMAVATCRTHYMVGLTQVHRGGDDIRDPWHR